MAFERSQFLAELKRRRVLRVAGIYAAGSYVAVEAADLLGPLLALPEWTTRAVLLVALLGLPIVVGLAWAFDLTRQGLRRTGVTDRDTTEPESTWFSAQAGALVIALVAVGAALGWIFRGTTAVADPVLSLPEGPSIAVLPFENLDPDPAQEYFGNGLTEDVITALGRFSDLFVIAHYSTAPYKGRELDIAEIRADLGVRYVLQGSVRSEGPRVRVTARLIDAASESALWAEAFDRELTAGDLFDLQDEITARVVGTIGGSTGVITRQQLAEARRAGRTDRLEAYECVLRAHDYIINHGPGTHELARGCLERAVELDPGYVEAWGWLAYTYAEESRHGWNRREGVYHPLDKALETAQRATRLDPGNFMAQVGLAVTRFDRHELDLFYEAAERALALNPNDANWLAVFGGYMAESGRWDRGMAMLDKATALNPNHPGWIHVDYSLANYRRGNYEAALAEALKINLPDYYRGLVCLVAAYGQLGRVADARAVWVRVLELRPDLVDEAGVREDLRRYNHPPAFVDHLVEGLVRAGVFDHGAESATPLGGDPRQTKG